MKNFRSRFLYLSIFFVALNLKNGTSRIVRLKQVCLQKKTMINLNLDFLLLLSSKENELKAVRRKNIARKNVPVALNLQNGTSRIVRSKQV